MVRLYRSATHEQHWFAYTPVTGWVMFPAKHNGWEDRHQATGIGGIELREVPLWMAFGTGLLSDAGCANWCTAA